DFGLADAGRADHQDVLRQHLLAQLVVKLQPPPAVAQGDRHGALGIGLPDDEAVKLGDDFAGREVGHRGPDMPACHWRIVSNGWISITMLSVRLSRMAIAKSASIATNRATMLHIGSRAARIKPATA